MVEFSTLQMFYLSLLELKLKTILGLGTETEKIFFRNIFGILQPGRGLSRVDSMLNLSCLQILQNERVGHRFGALFQYNNYYLSFFRFSALEIVNNFHSLSPYEFIEFESFSTPPTWWR